MAQYTTVQAENIARYRINEDRTKHKGSGWCALNDKTKQNKFKNRNLFQASLKFKNEFNRDTLVKK